jgi:hypothetical protein
MSDSKFLSPEVQKIQKALWSRSAALHQIAKRMRDQPEQGASEIMAQVYSAMAAEFELLAREL